MQRGQKQALLTAAEADLRRLIEEEKRTNRNFSVRREKALVHSG
jgi:hypothetical protein